MKNILIEVNHPGQVYLFHFIYFELLKNGHNVYVITKKNEPIEYLLQVFNIPYKTIGNKKVGIINKALFQIQHDITVYKFVLQNKIQLGLGSSVTNDHVSILSKMKSIHFSDDDEDIVPFITKFSYPFSDVILSPNCLDFKQFKHKNIGYSGYHELAYLHPNYFKPEIKIIEDIGISPGDIYFVLRFVALKGHHDSGHKGITLEQKKQIIGLLKSQGKIFITTEKEIEPEFEQYRLPVSPEKIHSLIYYATMLIGDSQTMTSEAAVLGTPAIKCNSFAGKLSVPNEIEYKYNLCYSFPPEDFDKMMENYYVFQISNKNGKSAVRRCSQEK